MTDRPALLACLPAAADSARTSRSEPGRPPRLYASTGVGTRVHRVATWCTLGAPEVHPGYTMVATTVYPGTTPVLAYSHVGRLGSDLRPLSIIRLSRLGPGPFRARPWRYSERLLPRRRTDLAVRPPPHQSTLASAVDQDARLQDPPRRILPLGILIRPHTSADVPMPDFGQRPCPAADLR